MSESSADDLQRVILGATPDLTSQQVVAGDADAARSAARLWRALGFPGSGSAAAFTRADRTAFAKLSALVDSGAIDLDTAVKLTRAVGYTMARLADWEVATLTEWVEQVEETDQGSGSRLTTAIEVMQTVRKPFEELMVYVWRRHLAAAVARVEALGAADADLHTQLLTVGFADLVSFTRLTTGIDRDRLADLVEDFETLCADLVAARGGRVIKTLGDSVLFVVDNPSAGVDIALDIVDRIGGDPELPDVHVGLATGSVVMRLGDVFGSPVNLASRLTGIARRNRVICDTETAQALRECGGFVVRPLTERSVRGLGSVRPMSVRRRR